MIFWLGGQKIDNYMIRKLKPIELRTSEPIPGAIDKIPRHELYIVLDNIMDTFNVGTAFRLADGVAAKKLLLCGITEAPPDTKVKRASVSTWQWVPFEKYDSTVEAIKKLKKEVPNVKVIAVEQVDGSIPYTEADYPFPVAIVVGHETKGISDEVIELCDEVVELPMHGINTSLNVIVALSVVVFKSLEGK